MNVYQQSCSTKQKMYMYTCTRVHVHVYMYICTCTCTCVHVLLSVAAAVLCMWEGVSIGTQGHLSTFSFCKCTKHPEAMIWQALNPQTYEQLIDADAYNLWHPCGKGNRACSFLAMA